MKIVLEVDVPDFEDRVSMAVKERQLSLDQLVAEISVSRETARRVIVGRERSHVHSVVLVGSQIGIDPREIQTLIIDAICREDFEAIVKKDKMVKNLPKKRKLEKTIKPQKSSQTDR